MIIQHIQQENIMILIMLIISLFIVYVGPFFSFLYLCYSKIKIKKIDKCIIKLNADCYELSHDIKMHRYNKCINFKKTAPLIVKRQNLKNRLKYVYTLKKYYEKQVDEFY